MDSHRPVIDLAQTLGWRVAHFRPSPTGKGWRTAVEADGAGFPDLVLVKGDRVLFREVKSGRGKLTEAQQRWLDALCRAGMDAKLWRLEDLRTTILEELRM